MYKKKTISKKKRTKNKRRYVTIFLILVIIFLCIFFIIKCNSVQNTKTLETSTILNSETKNNFKETTIQSTIKETTTINTTETDTKLNSNNSDTSIVITKGIINKSGNKQIALTFDSGWEYKNTEELLKILDIYNVKATFFTRGLWAKDHPELAISIVNHGHDLENHSLTHGHMTTMTDAEIENEINTTTSIIKETTGFLPQLFRPPYGEYDDRILKILKTNGYPYTILWSLDSYDWAQEMNGIKITKDYLVKRVLSKASNNGIILMHIGGFETVNALPEIITGLRSQGYEFVKVKDMLQ